MLRLSCQKRLVVLLTVCLMVQVAFGLGNSAAFAMGVRHPQRLVKQQIAALEDEWRSAALAHDLNAIENLLSDDYVGISWNGEVNTKAMQIDRMRTRNLVISKLDSVDSKIKVLGNVVIVTGRADVQGKSDGNDMIGIFRYTRVYQRLPSGAWKITNFEATRVSDQPGGRPHGPTTN
jgi:ketosteroid isomerase-like protein